MWIGMFAFLGVLIWVGYILMTNATRRPRGVLDARLARGEIDAAEYQRLRGLIATGDDPAPAGEFPPRIPAGPGQALLSS